MNPLVITIVIGAIATGLAISELIVMVSRKQGKQKGRPVMAAARCGRVHFGPMIEVERAPDLRWHTCRACGNKLSPVEQLAYLRTRQSTLDVMRDAIIGASTK